MAEVFQVKTDRVLINIVLKDGSKIEVCDSEVLDSCKVLASCYNVGANGSAVDVRLGGSLSESAIRFFFENARRLLENAGKKQEQLRICEYVGVPNLFKISEVADYLACDIILEILGFVTAYKMGTKRAKAAAISLGFRDEMTAQEKQAVKEEEARWFTRND